jgi:hypothetical protein
VLQAGWIYVFKIIERCVIKSGVADEGEIEPLVAGGFK